MIKLKESNLNYNKVNQYQLNGNSNLLKVNQYKLDKLIESIKIQNNLSDNQIDVLQNELSITISRFLDKSNLTTSKNEENLNHTITSESDFIMSVPLDNLNDLATSVNRSIDRTVKVFVETNHTRFIDTSHMDDEGDVFSGKTAVDDKELIYIGTVCRDLANQWSVRIDKSLPTMYVDIDQYVRCWSCHKNQYIRDFLNDIFKRINHLGEYQLSDELEVSNTTINPGQKLVLTNESVEYEDDGTTYEIEYNPEEVVVYLHEHFDLDLNEDGDTDNNEIAQNFFESLFGVDNSKVIVVNESLSRFLFDVGAAYALGKGAQMVLNKMGIGIAHRNPNTDKYASNIGHEERRLSSVRSKK